MKPFTIKIPCLRPVRLINRLELSDSFDKHRRMPSFCLLIRTPDGGSRRRQALASIAGLLMLGSLSSCETSATSTAVTRAGYVHQQSRLLATTALDTARIENARNELNLSGKITYNQDQVVRVIPTVSGRIESVKTDLGEYVEKGDVMAVIQSNYHQPIKNNSQPYVVRAPRSGFIVEKMASPGMELNADDPENLFVISTLDRVWVLASVYESELANLHVGDPAVVTTLSYPDKVFHGRIEKIVNVLGPNSRTFKVRVTLNNWGKEPRAYSLKPEMVANVGITYAGNDQRVAIPSDAIVFDRNRNYVVAIDQQNQPVVREIDIYKTTGQTTYLTSGLTAGDRVAITNQLLIYDALEN